MEELHEAALAYYCNAPIELQRLAWNFYLSLDSDGDEKVSLMEYFHFLQKTYTWIRPHFFQELDRNQDGYLDFWEVLTLYYAVKTRGVFCQSCQTCLVGLYFTCVSCFDKGSKTYDLCPTCYKRKRFNHQHSFFLDNHLLLRSKRGFPPGSLNVNQAIAPRLISHNDPPAMMNDNGSTAAFNALEMDLAMDKSRNNADACSIM